MQVDYLIVGQGVCGTLFSWFLHKEGKSFMVLDDKRPDTASHIAAGVMNPVTGRRYVYSWMIDTVMPFAIEVYRQLEAYLSLPLISQKSIIDFFPSPQMRDAFVTRITEDDTYIHSYPDQNHFNPFFNYDFGCGEVRPAYNINLQTLLTAWQRKLAESNSFRAETFDTTELQIDKKGVTYKDIQAEKIIFCDGAAATENPWFNRLPFAPNKGEALIIESEGLPADHIFKKGLMLVPFAEQNTFWVGANYQWNFDNDQPSEAFYQSTKTHLNHWLKLPFKILAHKAAVRPATLERRPFVGLHPQYDAIGILNGMGTKGTSLAPFFAHQLVQHLVHHFPVQEEADVQRFHRILSK